MPLSGTTDQRIATIASRQRGLVSRQQLLAAGLTSKQVHCRLVSGALRRLHRGVYAVGHAAPAPLAAETAALLACGEPAVLSHRSAALLWRIIPQNWDDRQIHITAPGRHPAQPNGVCAHRTQSLTPQEICQRQGLPLTSPARTLFDLAGQLDARGVERAVDEALLQRLISQGALAALAADKRPGAARVAAALDRHAAPRVTRSEAERRFYELIVDARLPLPQANVRLHGYEVDFYWPAQKLVVEIDGFRYHSSRPAFERDSAKGAVLVAHGIQVMRLTWLQLDDEPMVVVARVAQALARTTLRG